MIPTEILPKGIIPNELLAAEYRYTAQEIDLLMRIFTEIRMRSINPWYELPKRELALLMNNGGSAYENLRKALLGLQQKPLEYWNQQTNVVTICNIISAAQINRNTSEVRIYIHEPIAHWIKSTQSNYTEFELNAILKLRGKYSKLLYLKCSQWKFTGTYFCNVTELRKIFGTGDKYEHLHNLRAKVINPAIAEINANTDLRVEVKTNKKGRNIDVLQFVVSHATEIMNIDTDEKLLKTMVTGGLAEWQAKNVLATLPREIITKQMYDFQCRRTHISNAGAYLYATFKNLDVPMSKAIPMQLSIPHAS